MQNTSQSLSEILAQIDSLDLRLHLIRNEATSYNAPIRWYASLKKESEGMKLEVDKTGASVEDALRAAWEAFERAAYGGLPKEMLGTLLEGPRPEGAER